MVIEMTDVTTVGLFNGAKGDSMFAESGVSRRTDYEGSVGALTVYSNCPLKMEAHKHRAVENLLLKGRLADSIVQTRMLMEEV